VPVTGTQNPPYQITSEKEQGQTYSTNFHAISMMPAYRNASFDVMSLIMISANSRNFDLRIMHKEDDMELQADLVLLQTLVEPRQVLPVLSAVDLEARLRRTRLLPLVNLHKTPRHVDLVDLPLDQVIQVALAIRTRVLSAKIPSNLKHPPLDNQIQVALEQPPLHPVPSEVLQPVDSLKILELVHLGQNQVRSL
jgi:hypothetical protein